MPKMRANSVLGVVYTEVRCLCNHDFNQFVLAIANWFAGLITNGLHIEDRELDKLSCRRHRHKGARPVGRRRDLGDLKSVEINEMKTGPNIRAHCQLPHAAVGPRNAYGKANQVILANRDNFDSKRVLKVECVAVNIMGDKPLRRLHAHG